MLRFLIYLFNLPYPSVKVGDKFTYELNNPFNDCYYEVLEIKNGWVKCRYGNGFSFHTTSILLRNLRLCYYKIKEK